MPTAITPERDPPTVSDPPPVRTAPTARHQSGLQYDDQPILSIRASVPKAAAERFIADALNDIRVFMQEHDIPAAGPPFSTSRPQGFDLDIEAGWPTATQPRTGGGRIHAGSLPRSLIGSRDTPIPTETR